MKNVIEFIQKNKILNLFKYIGLSIFIIFSVWSIIAITFKILVFREISEMSKSDFEECLVDIEEIVEQDKQEAQKWLNEYDGFSEEEKQEIIKEMTEKQKKEHEKISRDSEIGNEMTVKHATAMTILKAIIVELNSEFEIMIVSIISGILVGLIIYMYKTSKNFVKLLIYYIILIAVTVLINEFLMPVIIPIQLFTFGYGYIFSLNMKLIIMVAVVLIGLKVIQNKLSIKKLNELVDNDEK